MLGMGADKNLEVWGTFTLPFPKLHLFTSI